MPLPLKDFPRSGEDVAQRQKGDKVSPKVTERAPPLPCGELPPQRLRGLQIGEARKMRLAKRLAFFRFDFCVGVTRGEQPLVRGSSASKSLALFWFSFVRQKRTNSARLQRVEIAAPLPSGASLTERHSSSALRIASFTTA